MQFYYRDDRVVRSLGLEPMPPYPRDHVLEDGDRSLLDLSERVRPCGAARSLRGRSAIPESQGSQLTRRWRGESAANSSLKMSKFPASRENTGNFIDSSLGGASEAAKKGMKSVSYGPIPYAS
jgi:hypothetical protein